MKKLICIKNEVCPIFILIESFFIWISFCNDNFYIQTVLFKKEEEENYLIADQKIYLIIFALEI